MKSSLLLAASFLLSFIVISSITGSREISIALAILISVVPQLVIVSRQEKKRVEIESVWPEAIENVISALHAGRTINESLIDLSEFGPKALERTWQRIKERISKGDSMEIVLRDESHSLQSPRADQFFATLIFAKNYGGHSIQSSLRHLASFMRDDQQVLDEIKTRFGWVRNSAALAAGAPWILLILLSAQPGTADAFATFGGKAILSCGVIATALAFLWMKRVAKLPTTPRIFSLAIR